MIVITYGDYEEAELDGFEPRVVHVDSRNRPTDPAMTALQAELHDLTD